jgi:hypothetical protein
MASIVHLKKLFIFYSKIVTKSKNVLVKFTFSIYNQQLFFTFFVPYSLYTNDDDNNGRRPSIMNRTSKFSNGIHVKKHGNYLRLECKNWWHNGCQLNCDDNMHVNLFTISLRLWLNAKNSTFTNMPFCKCYSCIFI